MPQAVRMKDQHNWWSGETNPDNTPSISIDARHESSNTSVTLPGNFINNHRLLTGAGLKRRTGTRCNADGQRTAGPAHRLTSRTGRGGPWHAPANQPLLLVGNVVIDGQEQIFSALLLLHV
jgi:hypothetical protein